MILLIGLPGSGKSTLAQSLLVLNARRRLVSTDAIRAELFGDEAIQGAWPLIWQRVEQRWRQATAVGLDVLYDATNTVRRQRRRTLGQARRLGFGRLVGWWLDVPLTVCLQRNQQRTRQVPEAVIQRMHRQLSGAPPTLAEGFDGLIRQTSGFE